jgi:hypothetical protein
MSPLRNHDARGRARERLPTTPSRICGHLLPHLKGNGDGRAAQTPYLHAKSLHGTPARHSYPWCALAPTAASKLDASRSARSSRAMSANILSGSR